MMHGEIRVESPSHMIQGSRGGPGSTFHFTAHFKPAPAGWRPRKRPGELRGHRVLVIDDNATNRRVLCELLSSWGMLPAEAENGDEAIRMVRESQQQSQPYDVLLLDFHMPGKDGFDVMRELREEPGLLEGVVMMLTSSEKADHKSQCRELDVERSLIKPVSASQLLDNITDIICPDAADETSFFEDSQAVFRFAPQLGLSILLAEDNEINRKVAQHILEQAGCEVVAVGDGRAAADTVKEGDFDAVLMDVQLPVLDGYAATGLIRKWCQETGKHLPVIAMTAHAMKGDRETCVDAGMEDYISKPIDPEELYDVLRRCTGGAGEEASSDSSEPGEEEHGCVPLDMSELLGRVGSDEKLARELVDLFRQDYPSKLASIRMALDAEDLHAVYTLAHELKGTAANLAAKATLSAALRLERAAESGDLFATSRVLEELEAALKDLSEFDL
jgi:CheY-like chemotaxis protein